MGFIKKLSGKNNAQSSCCGVEIKEVKGDAGESCCGTESAAAEGGSAAGSCCGTDEQTGKDNRSSCC